MPEAKGPAYAQMSVSQQPASKAESDKVGRLMLQHKDGVPVLTVTGGNVVPTGLAIVDETGNAVGLYTARRVKTAVAKQRPSAPPRRTRPPRDSRRTRRSRACWKAGRTKSSRTSSTNRSAAPKATGLGARRLP